MTSAFGSVMLFTKFDVIIKAFECCFSSGENRPENLSFFFSYICVFITHQIISAGSHWIKLVT